MNNHIRASRLALLTYAIGVGFVGLLLLLAGTSKASPLAEAAADPQVLTYDWQPEFVDDAKGQFGELQDHSLRLDGAGHPHLVYGGLHLYYAWHDGTQWHTEEVDGATGVGDDAVLVLEAAAPYTPHIAYTGTDGSLRYATRDNNLWKIQIVDGNILEYSLSSPSIVLAADGHPCIAYRGQSVLKLARWTGAAWDIQTVDSGSGMIASKALVPDSPDGFVPHGAGYFPSLVLDAAGNPHIGYVDAGYGIAVKHAYQTSMASNWSIEIVEQNIGYADDLSMALGTTGKPHLFYSGYFGLSSGQLHYTYLSGSTWVTQTIANTRSNDISLALTTLEEPRIVYHNGSGEEGWGIVRYGALTGGTWSLQSVLNRIGYPSLALDSFDTPHIGYYCPNQTGIYESSVRYAYWSGSAWVDQVVDTEEYVGADTSMALDPSGRPHMSYLFQANPHVELRHAYWTGSAWVTETVDSNDGNNLAYTALKVDTLGHPHIAYVPGALKYARWNGSAWTRQVVDSPAPGQTAYWRYPSLALDRNNQPHLSYYNAYDDGELKYAAWNGSAWIAQTVDSGLQDSSAWWSGGVSSLQLDANDAPHIVYYDAANKDLKYAYRNGSMWVKQTVDSSGDVGTYNSLALDTQNHPHISYRFGPWPDTGVRYAYWTGSTWVTQTVALGGNNVETSIVLGDSDNPCIAYGDVKYACRTGSEWRTSTVETVGGGDKSLTLDTLGYPHIGYYDYWNPALKYARLARSSSVISPESSAALVYTDRQGLTTSLSVPAGAVAETTTLVYLAASQASNIPSDLVFANRAFRLDAHRNNNLISELTLDLPATLAIHYGGSDVAGLDEDTLTLRYWNGATWSDAGISLAERDTTDNHVVFTITHLSEFALFGAPEPQQRRIFLPLVLRQ